MKGMACNCFGMRSNTLRCKVLCRRSSSPRLSPAGVLPNRPVRPKNGGRWRPVSPCANCSTRFSPRTPPLRGYVLDERGALRHHVVVFIDGEPLRDKQSLGDSVKPNSEIHVFQALSGG